MAQVITSKRFSLNWLDLAKAALVAGLTASSTLIFQLIEQWVTAPGFSFDKAMLVLIIKTTGAATVAYLLKQLFSPSKIILKGDDVTAAVQAKSEADEKEKKDSTDQSAAN